MMKIYLKRNSNDQNMLDIMTKDAYGWTVWATVHEDVLVSETIMSLAIADDLEAGKTIALEINLVAVC